MTHGLDGSGPVAVTLINEGLIPLGVESSIELPASCQIFEAVVEPCLQTGQVRRTKDRGFNIGRAVNGHSKDISQPLCKPVIVDHSTIDSNKIRRQSI